MSFGCEGDMKRALLIDRLDNKIKGLESLGQEISATAGTVCTCTGIVHCKEHHCAKKAMEKASAGRKIFDLLNTDEFEPAAKQFLKIS